MVFTEKYEFAIAKIKDLKIRAEKNEKVSDEARAEMIVELDYILKHLELVDYKAMDADDAVGMTEENKKNVMDALISLSDGLVQIESGIDGDNYEEEFKN